MGYYRFLNITWKNIEILVAEKKKEKQCKFSEWYLSLGYLIQLL